MSGQGNGSKLPWASRVRDGLLLVLGSAMLVAELVGSLLGRPADLTIVGAALALIGVVPVLQKEGK
jgi:hypothetical protein